MTPTELLKFARAPGIATQEQTLAVKDFLVDFQKMLTVYRAAYGDPVGLGVESHIDTVDWYINRNDYSNAGLS